MYLMCRACQFFTPGIPMVYYVGLFAGRNDWGVRPSCMDSCRSLDMTAAVWRAAPVHSLRVL